MRRKKSTCRKRNSEEKALVSKLLEEGKIDLYLDFIRRELCDKEMSTKLRMNAMETIQRLGIREDALLLIKIAEDEEEKNCIRKKARIVASILMQK